jgi:hypothetical protein
MLLDKPFFAFFYSPLESQGESRSNACKSTLAVVSPFTQNSRRQSPFVESHLLLLAREAVDEREILFLLHVPVITDDKL